MKKLLSLFVIFLFLCSFSFSGELRFLGELEENLNGYIGGTSFAFEGNFGNSYIYFTEADCGVTDTLIGKMMSVDSLGTTKGLDCVDNTCTCIFAKDIGGEMTENICLGELTEESQYVWQQLAVLGETEIEAPLVCPTDEVAYVTKEILPLSDPSLLSDTHKTYAKNLARKLRYFDKNYIKNFFLYVIELL